METVTGEVEAAEAAGAKRSIPGKAPPRVIDCSALSLPRVAPAAPLTRITGTDSGCRAPAPAFLSEIRIIQEKGGSRVDAGYGNRGWSVWSGGLGIERDAALYGEGRDTERLSGIIDSEF